MGARGLVQNVEPGSRSKIWSGAAARLRYDADVR
jgi:hypothetical protein